MSGVLRLQLTLLRPAAKKRRKPREQQPSRLTFIGRLSPKQIGPTHTHTHTHTHTQYDCIHATSVVLNGNNSNKKGSDQQQQQQPHNEEHGGLITAGNTKLFIQHLDINHAQRTF